ncbi:hypothetical protein [Streptomyces sp. NPDC059071]|uniref:hypothetical protein n=1 Tax=unclassified Streptomyces TaxID=2593676 RepID=UPI003668A2C5
MGYTTHFTGAVTVTPPLNPSEIAFLRKFAGTRRMNRTLGPYYVDGSGPFGQGGDDDIISHNEPPKGQPGLWCSWGPTDDGTGIEWNGAEKFYNPVEWMQYLIDHFLKPGAHAHGHPGFEAFTFDHTVNGAIDADGEEPGDVWRLVVTDNTVTEA